MSASEIFDLRALKSGLPVFCSGFFPAGVISPPTLELEVVLAM